MSYRKLTYTFPGAIEIEEHRKGEYGAPGARREKRKKPTPEQMARRNQWNKEKRARHRLRKYFRKNDYLSCLTYRKEERPADMAEAKKDFCAFMRKVRKEYRKRGAELRWIRNIEVGTRNGWHVHIVLNRIPDTDIILAEAWGHGRVVNKLLYESGEFRDLAAYITKSPKTDTRLREASYSTSKNLPLPEPEVKEYRRWKKWREIRIPDGYYLDRETLIEGENPFTGGRYRMYTLLRVERGG